MGIPGIVLRRPATPIGPFKGASDVCRKAVACEAEEDEEEDQVPQIEADLTLLGHGKWQNLCLRRPCELL